jgi:peptidoglycan/LPS O-acetylase OafA/YrhL
MTTPSTDRHLHIDLFKAVACQLIVLHHLAFYGPMADHADALAPALFQWLYDHARVAVQVFLVVSGYLCAQRLAPQARWSAHRSLPGELGQRYLRLVLPYAAMLVLAVAASALARRWMVHDSLSDPPTLTAVLAHLLLLHDLLDIEALSAGVWYVAIDLQLFALLALLLAGCAALERRWVRPATAPATAAATPGWAPAVVVAGVALSLLGFNREPDWDEAAPYFFGAYGLGVLACWWRGGLLVPARRWSWAVMALIALALVVEWRSRIAVAGLTALALMHARWPQRLALAAPAGQAIGTLGRISYAVFLVHFPVCLVVNALFTRFLPLAPEVQLLGVLAAWGCSVAAGAAFHHRVEAPLMRWVSSLRWAAARPARVPR